MDGFQQNWTTLVARLPEDVLFPTRYPRSSRPNNDTQGKHQPELPASGQLGRGEDPTSRPVGRSFVFHVGAELSGGPDATVPCHANPVGGRYINRPRLGTACRPYRDPGLDEYVLPMLPCGQSQARARARVQEHWRLAGGKRQVGK